MLNNINHAKIPGWLQCWEASRLLQGCFWGKRLFAHLTIQIEIEIEGLKLVEPRIIVSFYVRKSCGWWFTSAVLSGSLWDHWVELSSDLIRDLQLLIASKTLLLRLGFVIVHCPTMIGSFLLVAYFSSLAIVVFHFGRKGKRNGLCKCQIFLIKFDQFL